MKLTKQEIEEILTKAKPDIKFDIGIYEIYQEDEISIGVSYEEIEVDNQPNIGYIVNLFVKDEYINISGTYLNLLDAAEELTTVWNQWQEKDKLNDNDVERWHFG